LAELINGDRGKNYPSASAFVPSGVPFINAGHLRDGIVDSSEMNYITEERFALLGSGRIRHNDILYCLRGSLGKSAIVTTVARGAIASSLVIIRCSMCCLPRYLYYFLVSPQGQSQTAIYDNGSAQPNLSALNVKKYSVPVAPFNEQNRIVEKLDELLSDLDAGVAALRRAQASLKK
jgi:type I restriction enzyme S subunit